MRLNLLKILLYYWIAGWLILLLGRIGLMVIFVPMAEVMSQTQFWGLALWNMLRFDFQTLAYVATVPTLVFVVGSHLRRQEWMQGFARYYYSVVYTIIAILTVCDLGFYKNFSSHFNITVFDFFNEGPLTLLQAFWEEYPVVWMCLAIIAVFVIIRSLRFSYATGRNSYVLAVVWTAFVVVAMRGSVVEFPLQAEDMYVSPSQQFNDCVPNAMYSLKKAWSEKRKAFSVESEETLLARYGFESIDAAWDALGKEEHELFATARDTVEHQPDIVIILSESWSGYFSQLGLEQPGEELLCGMKHHLKEDVYLRNYQSVQNGTIASIENLVISSSLPRVFMSKYRYLHFPTSFATPFIESGYQAVFMSGMDEGWENVGIGLRHQGFSTVFKYELLEEHPEYKFNSVGIYDHHVMNSLFEHLNRPSAQPRLFVVMTTTNHPPFVYPEEIQLPSLKEAFYDHPSLSRNLEVEKKYIRGFQYANLSMASFLDRIKLSEIAENTIVVITGDHNVRAAIEYGNDGNLADNQWRKRVPFYMYLPPSLRGTADESYRYDASVYGCHYDLLPTLAPFALKPGVQYLGVGQNLLSDSLTRYNSYSYNVDATQADEACTFDAKRRGMARELLLRHYLWQFLTAE